MLVKYFTLNRRERNGIMILISFVFLLALAKYFIVYHYNPTTEKVVVVELDSIAAKLAMQDMLSPKNNSFGAGLETNKKEPTLPSLHDLTCITNEVLAKDRPTPL